MHFCEQTSAGAVMLTDVIFWLIIFPFLTAKDYTLSLVSTTVLQVEFLLFRIMKGYGNKAFTPLPTANGNMLTSVRG